MPTSRYMESCIRSRVSLAPCPKTRLKHLRPESMKLLAAFGFGSTATKEQLLLNLDNLPPVQRGQIVLVTGPSGSGKSTLLPHLIESVPSPSWISHPGADDDAPIIDSLGLQPEDTARLLAACGLTDAHAWPRVPSELSEGQRHRYQLAKHLALGEGTIVLDDWTSPLDRIAARSLAWTAGRVIRSHGRTAIIATTHEDIAYDLCPEIWLKVGWTPDIEVIDNMLSEPLCSVARGVSVRRGGLADYRPLAHLHYAAGQPQSPRSVWVAEHPEVDGPAAVAVLTYPDLRNPARDLATSNEYKLTHQRDIARKLNDEVARLARIVVRPELRGIGITRWLIEAIIENESIRWLECSTAMAHYSPFLDRLGFVEAPRPAHDSEAKLLDWADRMRINPACALDPEDLADEMDRMSVRQRREGRRLIWNYYHKHVLHRRTKAPAPKNVPNSCDDRWLDAFAFAARRLFERPRYMIFGPINDPVEAPTR